MKYYSILPATFLLVSCVTTGDISFDEMDYKYILDYESRVSQQKMENLRASYSISNVATFVVDGDMHFGGGNRDRKMFRKVVLTNRSDSTVYLNFITDCTVDDETSGSIYSIYLPRRKNFSVLLMNHEDYTIEYSWDQHKTNEFSKDFTAYNARRFLFTNEGLKVD